MLLSKLLGERQKEKPADAVIESHIFLLRGGYIRQVGSGIYSLLPPAKRIQMKLEKIIREEMDRADGQEVLFPVVLPAELWKESGRFESVGSELLRLKGRTGHDMLLGMTHEEAAVHLARGEAKSYTQYPFMIYQMQTKFRDEPRSRGGLIRVREFTMKDAYSFHTSEEDLENYYERILHAYHRIFERVGLPDVIAVGSDTGMMGGSAAHEFMLLSEAGEDTIVLCPHCGYRANMEVAEARLSVNPGTESEIEKVHTPGLRDIASLTAFFGTTEDRLCKAAVFAKEGSGEPVVVFLRGDLQVNEAKLKNVVGGEVFPYECSESDSLCFGFIGPLGLDVKGAKILFDVSLKDERNLICGANRRDYHYQGLSIPRDFPNISFGDVSKVREGDSCAKCGEPLTLRRGIEVGNIFQLGTKYTASMNMTYTDADGTNKHPLMGCYGIGIGRLLACIAEEHHDQNGPVWPLAVAPWQVHICLLNGTKEEVQQAGRSLYESLSQKFEVLMDDRNVSAGVQFADADLLGIPIRIIISSRNLANNEAELQLRDKSLTRKVAIDTIGQELAAIYNTLKHK